MALIDEVGGLQLILNIANFIKEFYFATRIHGVIETNAKILYFTIKLTVK